MPTLYKQIEAFRTKKNKPALSNEQLQELGKKVIEAYFLVKHKDAAIRRVPQQEPAGTFMVVDYPRNYVPEINRIIKAYYAAIEPKIRKRIPYKQPLNRR
jgi:hypothetical protein